ncbi:MAG: glycosyltransferase family 2 protein [Bacteroidetes bacterium]|nr:glycosyltransferase family 2 protein [Bacteroidota bacterium]
MKQTPEIFVIIPAFDEERSIDKVIRQLPLSILTEVIVVNNNSKDNTVEVARNAGATVLDEPEQGYGAACLKGIAYVNEKVAVKDNAIIVFIDGDFSDYPEQLPKVIAPILTSKMDMVIGSRRLGKAESGSLTPQQVFGNWLAITLIKWIYKFQYTDLGPFRAIGLQQLNDLNMQDRNYGWTVEMQLKALQKQMNITEVAVDYKRRIGHSKVSGTVKGSLMAGYKIIAIIIKYAFKSVKQN